MANFFLIDHSLLRPGGHHADYTCCISKAAAEMGFGLTIGTNLRLGSFPAIDELGRVRRVFRETTYQQDSYVSGLRHLTRSKTDFLKGISGSPIHVRILRDIAARRHRLRRDRFIRRFAIDCERFFSESVFHPGDHAFFTTVSELELQGLACFLSNHPRTLQVHWHLQFHYNLYDGRTPEYSKQAHVTRAVQACFDDALARVPYHSLHFYTTSENLSDQYQQLGVGDFDVLPYPVSPAFCKFVSG